jgi:hypothetical protein
LKLHSPNQTMEETTQLNSLGVRLHSKSSYQSSSDANTIGFHYFDDVFGLLVAIQADRSVELHRNEIDQFKLTDGELIERGIRNVKEKFTQSISPIRLLEYNFWLVENEFLFAPNFLFEFHHHPNVIGAYGSLFSIPNGDRLLIYPMENVETASALFALAKMSQYFYDSQSEQFSPKVYWYNKSSFQVIPLNVEDPDYNLFPQDFLMVLQEIKNKI